MDPTEFDRIAHELLDLFDQQVAAIFGRNMNDLSKDDLEAYQSRKRRIIDLRAQLRNLVESR